MQVDISKLRGKIVETGHTQGEIAKALGMDKSTFSRKMKGAGISFSIGDMHAIAEILGLSQDEACNIFLLQ